MKTREVATPLELVTAVVTPPAKLPLAPEAGAAKVTVTPLTGLLPASFTVTCSAEPNAVLIGALCGVPAVAVTDAGTCTIVVTSVALLFAGLLSLPPPDTATLLVTLAAAPAATVTTREIDG